MQGCLSWTRPAPLITGAAWHSTTPRFSRHPTQPPAHLAVVGVVQVGAARQARGKLRLEAAVAPGKGGVEGSGNQVCWRASMGPSTPAREGKGRQQQCCTTSSTSAED